MTCAMPYWLQVRGLRSLSAERRGCWALPGPNYRNRRPNLDSPSLAQTHRQEPSLRWSAGDKISNSRAVDFSVLVMLCFKVLPRFSLDPHPWNWEINYYAPIDSSSSWSTGQFHHIPEPRPPVIFWALPWIACPACLPTPRRCVEEPPFWSADVLSSSAVLMRPLGAERSGMLLYEAWTRSSCSADMVFDAIPLREAREAGPRRRARSLRRLSIRRKIPSLLWGKGTSSAFTGASSNARLSLVHR